MTVVKSFKGHAHDEYFFYFGAILSRFFKAQTKCLYGLEALHHVMEQRALKNVNNCLNTNIHSYLETSGGQRSNLYLNVVHFFNTSVN